MGNAMVPSPNNSTRETCLVLASALIFLLLPSFENSKDTETRSCPPKKSPKFQSRTFLLTEIFVVLFTLHCGVLRSCLRMRDLKPQKYEFSCANTCLRQQKMNPQRIQLYLPDLSSRHFLTSSVVFKTA